MKGTGTQSLEVTYKRSPCKLFTKHRSAQTFTERKRYRGVTVEPTHISPEPREREIIRPLWSGDRRSEVSTCPLRVSVGLRERKPFFFYYLFRQERRRFMECKSNKGKEQ